MVVILKKMDLNFLKWLLLHGPIVRRVLLRAFMLVLALIIVSLMQMTREVRLIEPIMSNIDECPLNVNSNPDMNLTSFMNSASSSMFSVIRPADTACKESEILIKAVFKELMGKNLLHSNARALCVGEGSPSAVLALRDLGLIDAFGVDKHPFFSLLKRRFVYELDFEDNHFDFVFSRDLDRVSVPALLVMEIERVLRPGATGAMLLGSRRFYSGSLVRSAASVASFLKSSDVVRLCGVDSFTLVIFKKRLETYNSFEHFQLPRHCPSVANNKPFMRYIEPIKSFGQFKPELAYLPKFMNISSRNKLVFIIIGAGEFMKTSAAKILNLYRSHHRAAIEVFLIDHKTSVLSSYVTNPGINFVYYPALGGDTAVQTKISSDEHISAPMHEKEFDFISWFNETVSDGDFIVLMMNTKSVELKILVEMYKTGAICRIDELFLRCSDAAGDEKALFGDCVKLFESLRSSGVYVHQWFGE